MIRNIANDVITYDVLYYNFLKLYFNNFYITIYSKDCVISTFGKKNQGKYFHVFTEHDKSYDCELNRNNLENISRGNGFSTCYLGI